MKLLIFTFLLIFIARMGLAEESGQLTQKVETVTPKVNRWKVNFDSLYFDFMGRHNADGDIYGFDDVSYQTQTLSMTYMADPTLHFSVVGAYARNYAETYFLGTLYSDDTEGVTDTRLKATKMFFDKTDLYIADVAISLPTGSIAKKNPLNPALNYPYNMQLGSGTVDSELSLMYLTTRGRHQVGAFGMATLRMQRRNEYGYRRGNEYRSKVWYSYLMNRYIQPGLWVNYWHVQRLSGEDRTYGRNLFVEFYHSPRHFWDVTANVNGNYPLTSGLSLKGMLGLPLWQESKNIDNVQVYTQFFAQLGVEAQF
ncbi:MAG: hypothetical protein HRT44_04880 [Bdellovibrionales bacterium]|nr:transporter [Bdellovibrionales bacterium]NQZ18576.1 hypothetical protein [Bdellovibrionales bacterium]